MGFFESLFGVQSRYSTEQKSLTRQQIDLLVSQSRVRTLDQREEDRVEAAIEQARQGGKISLRKIEKTLHRLTRSHVISINDERALMTIFETFFAKD